MPWVEEDTSPATRLSGVITSISQKSKKRSSKIEAQTDVALTVVPSTIVPTDTPPGSPGSQADDKSIEEVRSLTDAGRTSPRSPQSTSSRSKRAKALWNKAKKHVMRSGFIRQKVSEVSAAVDQRITMHKETLEDNRPEVALLIPAPDEGDGQNTDTFSMPPGLCLRASATLEFYGTPARLIVLQLEPSEDSQSALSPSQQLMAMEELLKKSEVKTVEDTVPWPLHEPRVTEAMLSREIEVLALESGSWFCSYISRILHGLRICSPDEDGPVLNTFRDQYGPSAAFAAVWGFFYVQCLWMLIPVVFFALLFDFQPAASGVGRIKFEFLKGIVICWGVFTASLCSTRFLGNQALRERERRRLRRQRSSKKTEQRSTMSKTRRFLMLVFAAFPCLLLLGAFCTYTLVMVTNMILHIIYVWGDCYNLHTPEKLCRDAEIKYGIIGWAAEVSCDIVLAILFELFFAMGSGLSEWISTLLDFEYENDKRYFKSMLEVFLSALERIGFVGSLAFAFVPQWQDGANTGDHIDMSISCSDLWMGESSYACYQRRLPLKLRRWLLEKLMKGPFMVAPFLAILIKTIVPPFAYKVAQACDYLSRCPGQCLPLLPARLLFRLLDLIFSLDGDNVGCFKFVCKGWPFTNVSPDPSPDGSDPLQEYHKGVLGVLEQAVLKPFEPDDELMELEMSFLWVLFFTPLKPFGVITTLIAKVLEINFDMIKMLHVRRRSFPVPDKVMRREQSSFVNAVLLASFGWTLGLSLITYNDDLNEWGRERGRLILAMMWVWFFLCAVLGFSKPMSLGVALFYAQFLDYRNRRLSTEGMPMPGPEESLSNNSAQSASNDEPIVRQLS